MWEIHWKQFPYLLGCEERDCENNVAILCQVHTNRDKACCHYHDFWMFKWVEAWKRQSGKPCGIKASPRLRNHDLEREIGQNFGNDGMYVVMETGTVRLLWCLKGRAIWLRRRARSGEVRNEQRSNSRFSQLAITSFKINMGGKGELRSSLA